MFGRLAGDKCVKWIAFGWGGFTVENLILSENRSWIIGEIGEKKYHTLYNSLSSIACGSVAFGYLRHGPGRLINKIGTGRTIFAGASLVVGCLGLSQLLPKLQNPFKYDGGMRCPFDFKDQDLKDDEGLYRVTRHPMLYSIGLFGLGLGLSSHFVGRLALCSGPLFVALVGTHHQDYRYRRGIGGLLTPERDQRTSNIPFQALIFGEQQWLKLLDELKLTNCCVGIGVAALLFLSARSCGRGSRQIATKLVSRS
jgi:uncharacterized membrane protein